MNDEDVKRKSAFEKLSQGPSRYTALSDEALSPEDAYLDSFNLISRLGPAYDILRHPDTQMPLTIAIYGTWGSGKTTAMKWLHGLIKLWNELGMNRGEDQKILIRPVWFYPWKYHSKEDVWRGLIAEVILKSIQLRGEDGVNISTAVDAGKKFCTFLGRSFVNVLSGLKLKGEVGGVGAELSLGGLKEIPVEYHKVAHPEEAYLNEFERTLSDWVRDRLGRTERMVIFIDDLDRCMPDIALQVLEALKLYLNIDKLIFVVGIDRTAIDGLIEKKYSEIGLDKKKKYYLAKIFQIEIELMPTDNQIEAFLDQQLDLLKSWQNLSPEEHGIFRDLILKLAERSPREVRRLINSATMDGAGMVMLSENDPSQKNVGFAQGLQLFFVRKILDTTDEYKKYNLASLVAQHDGELFFRWWSFIVRRRGVLPSLPSSSESSPYDTLRNDPRFSAFADTLLLDRDLGKLMYIEYPKGASRLVATREDFPQSESGTVIREVIARDLKKKPSEVTLRDFQEYKELDLSHYDIIDLELKELTGLQKLWLARTKVSDLRPLKGLTDLQELFLDETGVSDLRPLKGLRRLRTLSLTGTKVSDLEPLKELTGLQKLWLASTKVSDLEPLRELTDLQGLSLDHTKVSDLRPLKGLKKLQTFWLPNTSRISDFKPLKDLTSLRQLSLSHTEVSDLEPLKGLTDLQELHLYETRVSDLEPLKELTGLRHLSLIQTEISDLEPLKALTRLQRLWLNDTKVSDLGPLEGLTNLRELFLTNTRVSDLGPLKGLTDLQELLLANTRVSDLGPLKGLTNLRILELGDNMPKLKKAIDNLLETLPQLQVS